MFKSILLIAATVVSFQAKADCIPFIAKVNTWEASHPRNFTAGALRGTSARGETHYYIDAGPFAYTPPSTSGGRFPIAIPAKLDTNRLVEMQIRGPRPGVAMVRVRVIVDENPRVYIYNADGTVWDRFTAFGTCPNNSLVEGRSSSVGTNWQMALSYQQRP